MTQSPKFDKVGASKKLQNLREKLNERAALYRAWEKLAGPRLFVVWPDVGEA